MSEITETQLGETRSVPAVQQAMKQLTQFINSSEAELARLTRSEEHQAEQIRALTQRVREVERQLFDSGEESRRLLAKEKELTASNADLTRQLDERNGALERRMLEAEERAATYGLSNDELREKAELGERLITAAERMIEAIERLPVNMNNATMIRATSQSIPLYDSYEWQAVSDARFLLVRALGEPPEEMGG